MKDFIVGLCAGWALGATVMYFYIIWAGLFRSRREFYANRLARGKKVPSDWDEVV